MITVEQHLDHVLTTVPVLAPRHLTLTEALGCVLVEDVVATLAVPPFDNSAMDGYAVRAADIAAASVEAPVRLRVVADLPAGSPERPEVGPGTAVRIMTGAPVPPGADAVVPVEATDQPAGPGAGSALPEHVEIREAPVLGAHIRRAGGDIRPGDPVLALGSMLGPRDLAAAASTGHGTVLVQPPVRVGVLSTGAELVRPGMPLGPGQIPDSNSTLVTTLVATLGSRPVPLGSVPDDAETLRVRLRESLADVDVVVTTGGVSAGAYDVVKEVLAPLGDVTFTSVAMQPGKPQGFGVLHADDGRAVPIFALPGNPVSVFVSFVLFVDPALRVMGGLARPDQRDRLAPLHLDAVADAGWRTSANRRQYMPVVIEERDVDGEAVRVVRPAAAGGSGSHLVGSLSRAAGLAVVEAEVDRVHPGDAVRVMMVP
ncbi:MAG: molybdopterin molybdotransferase MoeA [Georgenia sp.]